MNKINYIRYTLTILLIIWVYIDTTSIPIIISLLLLFISTELQNTINELNNLNK